MAIKDYSTNNVFLSIVWNLRDVFSVYLPTKFFIKDERVRAANILFKVKGLGCCRAACGLTINKISLYIFFWEFFEYLIFRALVSSKF